MVDVSGVGGTVLGLAGMGIGLGILAHTASNITRMTDRMYEEPYPRRRPQYGRPRRLEVTGRDELPERRPYLFQGTGMRPRPRPISRPISRPRPRPITTHKPRMYDNVWRV